MSFLNGTVLLIISNIFLSLIIGNIGNQYVEKGFVFSVSIIILSLVCVGFFGGLILYNVLPNKNNS
jgi:uncharacterized membrane protein